MEMVILAAAIGLFVGTYVTRRIYVKKIEEMVLLNHESVKQAFTRGYNKGWGKGNSHARQMFHGFRTSAHNN